MTASQAITSQGVCPTVATEATCNGLVASGRDGGRGEAGFVRDPYRVCSHGPTGPFGLFNLHVAAPVSIVLEDSSTDSSPSPSMGRI